ncbi:unnamed protein product [Ilex paraguariensis]|uniref:USP domain-containing protein n=1 Tax=Ilex paraguariensis TaxID=185542 RepID=A0ABC8T0F6_9AQUA
MVNALAEEKKDHGVLSTDISFKHMDGSHKFFGKGMRNYLGESKCFFDATIQSLWHLRRFRDEFFSLSRHVHVGDPCVVCALRQIFEAPSMGNTDRQREAIALTSLRISLSNLYPSNKSFQGGQDGDAFEVLEKILSCLHQSFTYKDDADDANSEDRKCTGSSHGASKTCIAHTIFGLDVLRRVDCKCGLQSGYKSQISYATNIAARELRQAKIMHVGCPFDELLKLLTVDEDTQFICETEAHGCGAPNHFTHVLSTPPHILTVVIHWQTASESADTILTTLIALNAEVDVGILYQDLDQGSRHVLVLMVCYRGHHYYCFANNHEHERWIVFKDENIKVIGSWDDLLFTCANAHLQPRLLFFEAIE